MLPSFDDGIKPTRLFSKNADVDKLNESELAKLPTEAVGEGGPPWRRWRGGGGTQGACVLLVVVVFGGGLAKLPTAALREGLYMEAVAGGRGRRRHGACVLLLVVVLGTGWPSCSQRR